MLTRRDAAQHAAAHSAVGYPFACLRLQPRHATCRYLHAAAQYTVTQAGAAPAAAADSRWMSDVLQGCMLLCTPCAPVDRAFADSCVSCFCLHLWLPADTENKFVSTGFAEEISKAAGGEMLSFRHVQQQQRP